MMDCGLIFGKPEGLSAKWWGFSGFGIIFNTKIMVDSVHGSWTGGGGGARSTMDQSAARTGGHGSEAARSPEFGPGPLPSSKAHRRGSAVERGGW
jgi:hypothetical protein